MTRATVPSELATEPDARAVTEAANAVRRLVSSLRKTRAPAALLESVRDRANALADALEPHDHPGPYAQRRLVLRLDEHGPDTEFPAEFFPYSPVVGPLNPIAPPVEFRLEGESLVALHSFDAPYNGPPTAVHGGIIALVFDELLGCLGAMLGVGGFTGTLRVRYVALTPIGQPIRMRSWVDRREGRKVFIKGTMHDGDTLCAEAEGIFIQPKASMLEDALARQAER